jgi:hypothetical protein
MGLSGDASRYGCHDHVPGDVRWRDRDDVHAADERYPVGSGRHGLWREVVHGAGRGWQPDARVSCGYALTGRAMLDDGQEAMKFEAVVYTGFNPRGVPKTLACGSHPQRRGLRIDARPP